ncbi:unnamed protein product [Darwinula stevensoni]|uniref:Uncharacterized protein n=1 Tax=Darwinula stevensoni TaxID=69355 RepID=A0A7R8X4Q3_9CRUS|nr:unnamed protein product [Darwinula stevensoni]CAG0886295.1 unnamed protein product [Darwinula stevensoni]
MLQSGSGGEGEGSEGDVGSEGTSQSHPDEQTPDDDYLSKFRQQEREERQEIEAELRQATTGLFGSQRGGGSPLGLPLLPGMRGPPRVPFLPVGTPPPPSSTASSPTESTTPSQSAWSFEEQFKQTPTRKEGEAGEYLIE